MTPFRVALSGDFFGSGGTPVFPEFDLSPLRDQAGLDLVALDKVPEITPEQVADIDALILLGSRVSAATLEGSERLSVVARFGVGYDNVDTAACDRQGVALVITPDGVRRPVAVSILTMMFALTGKLMVKDRLTRLGPQGWAQKTEHNGVGLVGLTLGSIGIGNIGAEMFRLARPLDMTFIAHDPFADPGLADELGIQLVDLETLFRQSDILAVNCPLTDATRHLVNADRLALMKPTAYLINTARGPIVDQKALTAALKQGAIAGAGLDVFEKEPPDADDPILALDSVIVTPHALCWTDQIFEGNGAADVRAVLDIMQGRVPRGIVNTAILENAVWRRRLEGYAEAFPG